MRDIIGDLRRAVDATKKPDVSVEMPLVIQRGAYEDLTRNTWLIAWMQDRHAEQITSPLTREHISEYVTFLFGREFCVEP